MRRVAEEVLWQSRKMEQKAVHRLRTMNANTPARDAVLKNARRRKETRKRRNTSGGNVRWIRLWRIPSLPATRLRAFLIRLTKTRLSKDQPQRLMEERSRRRERFSCGRSEAEAEAGNGPDAALPVADASRVD